MKISLEQLKLKPKRIGHVKGVPVFECMTKGGFNLVILGGGMGKVLGAGPHRGMARMLAKQRETDFIMDELSKSEEFDPKVFEHLLPTWSEVVDRLNKE